MFASRITGSADLYERDQRGRPVTDLSFLMWFNAHDGVVECTAPADITTEWALVLDTAGSPRDEVVPAGHALRVEGKSLVVLRVHVATDVTPDHSVAASLESAARERDDTTHDPT